MLARALEHAGELLLVSIKDAPLINANINTLPTVLDPFGDASIPEDAVQLLPREAPPVAVMSNSSVEMSSPSPPRPPGLDAGASLPYNHAALLGETIEPKLAKMLASRQQQQPPQPPQQHT